MPMTKGYGTGTDKIKKTVQKPTGEKSLTHQASKKGKPADLNWKNPNGGKKVK